MFNEDELKAYEAEFTKLGVTDKNEQLRILEFIYSLGVLAYETIQ